MIRVVLPYHLRTLARLTGEVELDVEGRATQRSVLDALEASQREWAANSPVGFFVLWPEEEDELRRWYEELCRQHAPRFELHGHGYAPLWWLVEGQVVDCMSRPYEASVPVLQSRSARAFRVSATRET